MPAKKRKTHKRKHALSGIASMGSKIMTKAKTIRRAHPSKKWTSCVSEAAKSLKKR